MKILIATDGSDFGRHAVDFAADIIGQPDTTEVMIISVVEPFTLIETETLIESTEELVDPSNEPARQAKANVSQLAQSFKEKFGDTKIEVAGEVLAGPAARTIVEKAEEWGADLIVVGSHGYGFWKRSWLGSVSDRVIHHAPCSVMVVKTKSEEEI